MAHPYDQWSCPLPDGDSWGGGNLPDYDCQKAEDQVWCLDGAGSGFPYGGAWAGGWGEHYPQVPAGSVLFGLYDGGVAPRDGCDTSRSDYCSWVDQDNTCLGVRLYQQVRTLSHLSPLPFSLSLSLHLHLSLSLILMKVADQEEAANVGKMRLELTDHVSLSLSFFVCVCACFHSAGG